MAKFNIREQDPQKYSAVKAEQDKLSAICGVQMKIARICPYCGHTVSIVYKGRPFLHAGKMQQMRRDSHIPADFIQA